MSYMWDEFNIKTFPAETIVYRDGLFCPDLSTLKNDIITTRYDLPIHVIYVGKIDGNCALDVNIGVDNQNVFISVDVDVEKSATLNIDVKNAGFNSQVRGNVMIKNSGNLELNINARHLLKNTGILIHTKLYAGENSFSKISGVAIIDRDCPDCESDIGFSAMAEQGAKIQFMPAQRISAEPARADHSAGIFRPADAQIQYLNQAGLDNAAVKNIMKEAFLNSNDLF
ncbi:MAG: SufD family Fe-S cluster assembly protein [Alphaproteobacteria bacterium]|nr:SufD family Fe-S cluster assembly protein [Alphaproteobacteria bacterium]MBR2482908.1 SufD family Fe-S cluster assembly protein [Alphaproteobacteria bacterium]